MTSRTRGRVGTTALAIAVAVVAGIATTPAHAAGTIGKGAALEEAFLAKAARTAPSSRQTATGEASGTIDGFRAGATAGSSFATYTTTSTICSASGFCGWFPYAVQQDPALGCFPHSEGDGRLTYVGDVQETSGTQGPAEAEFFPAGDPVKVCLYVYSGDGDHLAAEVVHDLPDAVPAPEPQPQPAPAPPPPPAPAPAAQPDPQPQPQPAPLAPSLFLEEREVRSVVRGIIRDETGRSATDLTYACARVDDTSFTCEPSWRDRRFVYAVSLDVVERERSYSYRGSGSRASRRCLGRQRRRGASIARAVRRCTRQVRF